jgi:CPA2 family monovalent cation:H+ antiporter-2
MHSQDLTALALVLAAAVIAGLIMNRLRLPAVSGFILVGTVLGPTGFALIENSTAIETLADLGVLMLLFILGMELRLQSFRRLLPLAVGVTVAQILVMTGVASLVAQLASGETSSAIVIGFMLAISSTAVGIKMMGESGDAQSPAGKLAVAILVAQDLAVVPLLLIVNALAPHTGAIDTALVVGKLFGAGALLIGFIVLLTRVKSFRFPASEFFLKDFDVGTLGVLGICFAAATVSGLLGLSPALGAFLAGLAVGHSTLRRTAQTLAQPVQSILIFIFFLSIGLLIDLHYVLTHLWLILLVLAVVTLGKTTLNLALLRALRQPGTIAFPAALFLSPVGEFSFVLATAAAGAGALTPEGHKLAIAVIALSLLVSPLWFIGARRAHMLALRGITCADVLIRQSYARELAFLGRIRRSVVRNRDTAPDPERKPPAPMEAIGPDDADDYLEPFVDVPRTPLKSPPAAPAFRRPQDPGE